MVNKHINELMKQSRKQPQPSLSSELGFIDSQVSLGKRLSSISHKLCCSTCWSLRFTWLGFLNRVYLHGHPNSFLVCRQWYLNWRYLNRQDSRKVSAISPEPGDDTKQKMSIHFRPRLYSQRENEMGNIYSSVSLVPKYNFLLLR
jgi:hypothetical protein